MRSFLSISTMLLILQLILVSCSSESSQVNGGSGHEWEARALVSGIVVDSIKGPVDSVIVQLVPLGYNPLTNDTLPVDTTDSQGCYHFLLVPDGMYTIQGVHASKRTRLMSRIFTITSDTVDLNQDTLKTPSAVTVPISSAITSSGIVFARGTTIQIAVTAGTRFVTLDSLAPGILTDILFAPGVDSTPRISLAAMVEVSPVAADTLADFRVYTDQSTIVTGLWNSAGTLVEDSTDPYEGRYHYRFDYSLVNWSSQCGINFDNWLLSPPSDVRAYRSLHCAYKGATTGHSVYVRIFDVADSSSMVLLGPASSTYQSVDISLSKFTNIDLSKVREIMFLVSDAVSGSGTVYFDDIRFTRTKMLP